MRFGPPFVNVYLVRVDGGYLLVDTGMGTNECFAALDRTLVALGVEWTSIREILITHLHPDHTGLALRLKELTGARISMHAADTALLGEITTGSAKARELDDALRRHGAPDAIREATLAMYQKIVLAFPSLRPDVTLSDRQMVGPWQVIHTPGHAPGHICLYHSGERALISGDHVIEDITPHIGWMDGHDALGDFLDSLDRLATLDAAIVLPSHGEPFHSLQAWLATTRKHHEDRCRQIEQLVSVQRLSVAALVAKVWPRELKPLDYQLAFTEILSHLVYLERRGRVRSVAGQLVQWRGTFGAA